MEPFNIVEVGDVSRANRMEYMPLTIPVVEEEEGTGENWKRAALFLAGSLTTICVMAAVGIEISRT